MAITETNVVQAPMLLFSNKNRMPSPKNSRPPVNLKKSGHGEGLSEESKRQFALEIARIMDSATPLDDTNSQESMDCSSNEDEGYHVVTTKQFRLLQWATKQLEIRHLQDECNRILEEIEMPTRQ